MKTGIGISDKNSEAVALVLNQLLADEHVLYVKTRNYHWNIEGKNFLELHKFYETLYTELADAIDEVAERIRKIGHFAEGRLKDFIKLASLQEEQYTSKQEAQLQHLLDDHETLCRIIREQIGLIDDKYADVGTVDFLTGLLKQHEKWAWMVRAYLH